MSEFGNSIEGIILVHRDIRVGRRQTARNLVTAVGDRAQQLAMSIGYRYISRFLRPPRLKRIFFRPEESAATQIHNVHRHLTLEHSRRVAVNMAPRINLTVVNWPQQPTETSPAYPGWGPAPIVRERPASVPETHSASPWPQGSSPGAYPALPAAPPIRLRSIQMIWRQASKMAANHTLNAHRRLVRWQQQSRDEGQIAIVQRLLKRSSRIDSAESAAALSTGSSAMAQRPPARVVPRILRRPPIDPGPAVTESQPRPEQPTIQSRQANWPQAAAALGDLPPVDINRLTEQVVRNIDRHIIAHRERMGRM